MMWSSCVQRTLSVFTFVGAAGLGLGTSTVPPLAAVAFAFCRWDFLKDQDATKADYDTKEEAD
jgi:hypothetical protein